jgi:predicted membrane protein
MEHSQIINNAVVTMDVAHSGVIWGWMITLNLWAKSIATGAILVGAFLLARHKDEGGVNGIRKLIPILAFIFLNIFLLFTLLDLHQPLRMINIFLHPHFTSAITVGAWIATALTGVIALMAFLAVLKNQTKGLYDMLLNIAVVLAIPTTLYTAVIMGEASARELWQTPAELVQMAFAALLGGSAILSFFSGDWSKEARRDLAIVLGVAAALSFIMYMGEYFFSWKGAEVEATMAFIHSGGEWSGTFWLGQILGYIIPIALSIVVIRSGSAFLLKIAALSALIGLFIAKHVWLIIPQLLPLS